MSVYFAQQAARDTAIAQHNERERLEQEQQGILKVDHTTFQSIRTAQPTTLSPTELIALCDQGMMGLDLEIAQKTSKQRKAVSTLKTLNELKAKMAKHQQGLNKDDDKKRTGEASEKSGAALRRHEYDTLKASFEQAKNSLPEDLKHIATDNIRTMKEKLDDDGRPMPQFDQSQANRMSENINSAISDIETRQQAEMAEINSLVSKRSNMIEMTKNIATALSAQQESIAKNAPR